MSGNDDSRSRSASINRSRREALGLGPLPLEFSSADNQIARFSTFRTAGVSEDSCQLGALSGEELAEGPRIPCSARP